MGDQRWPYVALLGRVQRHTHSWGTTGVHMWPYWVRFRGIYGNWWSQVAICGHIGYRDLICVFSRITKKVYNTVPNWTRCGHIGWGSYFNPIRRGVLDSCMTRGGGHKVPGLEKVSQTPSRHHPTPPRHHQKPPDTPQTPPRHPQTTSRHPPDTTQTPPVTPRQHPDTTTIQPSSTWPCRHPSDTP